MKTSLISNPPYNMKWERPPFAQIQPRFAEFDVPPESNANYAFILTGLEMITETAVFLLPMGVLTSVIKEEYEIRKELVRKNLIDYVISLPDGMFESTAIPVCILGINKNKTTTDMMMIDMRERHETITRKQRGQFGGASHTERVYKKKIKVIPEQEMTNAIQFIEKRADEPGYAKRISCEDVKENDYNLSPQRFIDRIEQEIIRRPYRDITNDINRVISEKNGLKLTINETLAKRLGLYEISILCDAVDISKAAKAVGCTIEKNNYIRTTKNAGEFSFSNTRKDEVSSILLMILDLWKHHIFYLNNEENRLLIEFRDALLPDLMSGKMKTAE